MLDQILQIARAAGAETLGYYRAEYDIHKKSDNSPVTCADLASHRLIRDRLRALTPEIPIVSEESTPEEIRARRAWPRLWLIDPLDGTKEFIKGSDEFAVMIALIEGGRPVLGVAHAPALGLSYYAERGAGAWRRRGDEPAERIGVRKANLDRLAVVASRDHGGESLKRVLAKIPNGEVVRMGSALKICTVAEGRADIYLRIGNTSEWDVAAGQCIVEEAGGAVMTLDGAPLGYNDKEGLLNPSFMCVGDTAQPWTDIVASWNEPDPKAAATPA